MIHHHTHHDPPAKFFMGSLSPLLRQRGNYQFPQGSIIENLKISHALTEKGEEVLIKAPL